MKSINQMIRPFWIKIVLILFLNQIALCFAVYYFVIRPGAESVSVLSAALVDAIASKDEFGGRGFGAIEELQMDSRMVILKKGDIDASENIPAYPGLLLIRENIQSKWLDSIKVLFQKEPYNTLWFKHLSSKPFAIGYSVNDRARSLEFILLTIFALMIFSALAARLVLTRLSYPMEKIAQTAIRIGRGERVGPISLDQEMSFELKSLVDAINTMYLEIESITQERREIVAGVAHDMRTPLARLNVAIALLENSSKNIALGMEEDIYEISMILEQFLEQSKLDTEKSEPLVIGDLANLVLDSVKKYRRLGANIETNTVDDFKILHRPLAFKRLMNNLIDNGLKHGNGRLTIELRRSVNSVSMIIKNNLTVKSNIRDSVLVSTLKISSPNGLGLGIITRLAHVHHANVIYSQCSEDDMKVEIVFPIQS